jgi:hypothetical protein
MRGCGSFEPFEGDQGSRLFGIERPPEPDESESAPPSRPLWWPVPWFLNRRKTRALSKDPQVGEVSVLAHSMCNRVTPCARWLSGQTLHNVGDYGAAGKKMGSLNFSNGSTPAIENSEPNLRTGWKADTRSSHLIVASAPRRYQLPNGSFQRIWRG